MIPIFVIHVFAPDRHDYYVSRRDTVSARLTALGLAHEVVRGVDGNCLTAAERARFISDEVSREKYAGFVMAPYQRGCALSHIQLYERIVREGIPEALILEDDAVVGESLPAVLAA